MSSWLERDVRHNDVIPSPTPREALTFKISLHAAEPNRKDVARKQERWMRHRRIDSRRLVFMDKTWATTNMTGTHGRSRRDERLVAKVLMEPGRGLTWL